MSKIYKPNIIDPNKIKKCNCENKYGPKPFDNKSSTNKSN